MILKKIIYKRFNITERKMMKVAEKSKRFSDKNHIFPYCIVLFI